MPKKRMVRIVTATEAKNRFGTIIKKAYSGEQHLIVERGGIPVVAIVPIQDYERLIADEDLPSDVAAEVVQGSKAASSRERLRSFLDEAWEQMPDIREEEVDADIQEAVEAARQQT